MGHCLSRTIGKREVKCSAAESPDDIMTHVPTRQPLEFTDSFAPSGRPGPKRRTLAGGQRRFCPRETGNINVDARFSGPPSGVCYQALPRRSVSILLNGTYSIIESSPESIPPRRGLARSRSRTVSKCARRCNEQRPLQT